MGETGLNQSKTPWHLWVVGVISLLWNAVGAMDFTLTQMKHEAYLKAFTAEQIAYFAGFPLWLVLAWGTATWGSLIGSGLLLARRKLAVPVNLTVLVAMGITFTHNYVLTDGMQAMGGGAGALIFTLVIVVIGVALYAYARAMRKRGVLR